MVTSGLGLFSTLAHAAIMALLFASLAVLVRAVLAARPRSAPATDVDAAGGAAQLADAAVEVPTH